ncbi:MAG: hypothetical protein M1812_005230 [Candelaria pacifica]|nr:MAG: hypothetical protein M1812_005230 [Candelaria pacifica]
MPSTRYALRSNPKEEEQVQPFRFLSLPPELRLRIYRLLLKRNEPISISHINHGNSTGTDVVVETRGNTTTARRPTPLPPPSTDPLDTSILGVSKLLHHEGRPVLYSENTFTVHTGSAIRSLNALHQRSRSLIQHVSLSIPSYYDILDEFPDIVRLGLRYCWGLKTLVITLPFTMPDDDLQSTCSRRSVFANAFHIIRWLPKQTKVRLDGIVPKDIAAVVDKHMIENRVIDEVSAIHILEPMYLN